MSLICTRCGTPVDQTLVDSDDVCPGCGADGEVFTPLSETPVSRPADSLPLTLSLDEYASVTSTVVRHVAEIEGVDPVDLDPDLYSIIDPEALDRLFAGRPGDIERNSGRVIFEYRDFEITVTADGILTIARRS